ncbi:MAG: hypothetical protein MZU91_13520 [Desulfosudis oleivorans]|nr:hypothetical protein [Desulfosudis oleivorans]
MDSCIASTAASSALPSARPAARRSRPVQRASVDRPLRSSFVVVGQELVQRRVDQADDDRAGRPSPRTGRRSPRAGRAAARPAPRSRSCAGLGQDHAAARCGRRSVSKNMCSVRHRPMPSAP